MKLYVSMCSHHGWPPVTSSMLSPLCRWRIPRQQRREETQTMTQLWKTRLDEYGMRLNTKKTEYLEGGPQTDGTIIIDNKELKKTEEFRYLGSVISYDGNISSNVRARINAAWLKWQQVTGVLCDRRMPDWLKGKTYKTVVRPVALYGSACWPALTTHEQALNTMEMRVTGITIK